MKRFYILFVLACAFLNQSYAQENIVLSEPINGGTHEYEAIQSVKMVPGFSYVPMTTSDRFSAKINPFILTPPEEGITGGPDGLGGIVGNTGIVGATNGSFAVSETGQATYVVPLEFPGGIGGMTPDLSLVYNSNGGDGILGPGWSLAGLSVISMVPPTRYHNGIKDATNGLDYIENNYMLDGQKLIVINEDNTTSWREYRTEADDFKKIERHNIGTGGKDTEGRYFKVQTKGGLTYIYGRKSDSRQGFNGGSISNPTLYTINYYLDSIMDNYGNTIAFNYINNINSGELYVQKIDYTFTAETSKNDPSIYSIEFNYIERNSPVVTNYLYTMSSTDTPVSFTSNKLIENIICRHNESSTIVKKYKIDYEPKGPITLGGADYRNLHLKTIQEIGLNGEKYNQTVFEWEQEIIYPNILQNSTFNLPPITFEPYWHSWGNHIRKIRHLDHAFLDIDNDGLQEIIRTYEVIEMDWVPSGWDDPQEYNHYFAIEILKPLHNSMEYEIQEYHTFRNYDTYELYWEDEAWLPSLAMFRFADFNGNGFVDIALTKYDLNDYNSGHDNKIFVNSHLYLFENNNGTWQGQFTDDQTSVIEKYGFWVPYIGDFNGDAIADVLLRREKQQPQDVYGQLDFYLGNPIEPLNSHEDSDGTSTLKYTTDRKITNQIELIDINGDSRTEIIQSIGNQKTLYRLDFNNANELNMNDPVIIQTNNKSNFLYLNSDSKLDYINIDVNTTTINNYNYDIELNLDLFHGGGARNKFIDKGSISFVVNSINEQQEAGDLISAEVHSVKIVSPDITNSGQNEIIVSYGLDRTYVIDDDSSPYPGEPYYYSTTEYYSAMLISNKAGDNFTLFKSNPAYLNDIVKSFQLANINGNNQPDFFKVNDPESDTPTLTVYSPSQQGTAIKRIINGLGNEILIDYGFSSDPEVYTSDFSDEYSYPVVPFICPLKLVKNAKKSNGTGGYLEETYQYENALIHAEGKGFLGFEKTTRTNVTQGMQQITEYGVETNDNLYYVYPQKSTQMLLDGEKISESTHVFNHFFPNTLNNDPESPTRNHFVYESSRTTTTWDLEGDVLKAERITNQEFDNFGNLKRTLTEIAPNPIFEYSQTFETITEQKYHNNVDAWILGRLYEAKVIQKAPGQTPITRESDFLYYTEGIHIGMLKEEIVEPNKPKFKTIKTYDYDIFGNILKTVLSANDPLLQDRINESSYDADSKNIPGRFLTQMITHGDNDVNLIEKRKYDPLLGNLEILTDPNNLETHYEYNGFGQVQKEIMHDGNQSHTVLRWVQEGDEDAPEHAVFYSWSATSGAAPVKVYFTSRSKELRNVTVGFDGTLVYVDTQYDNQGRLLKKSDPYFKNGSPVYTQYTEYDELNRPLIIKHPDNTETSFAYTGLTTSTTNAKNQTNSKTINVAGWLVRSKDANGNEVMNLHRSDGLVTSRFILGGVQTARIYEYDLMGNLTMYYDKSQDTLKYEYDAYGQLRKSWNAHGQLTSYHYDRLGRLIQKVLPEGAINWNYHDEAGKLGLLESVKSDDHSIIYNNYDEMGRPLQVTEIIEDEPQHFVKSFTYDVYGRLQNYTYPVTGFTIENQYNSYGYQDRVINSANNHVLWEANSMNARSQFTGVSIGGSINQTFSYYNATGRLFGINAGNYQYQNEYYVWDEIGNLTLRGSKNQRYETFQYDELNRLTKQTQWYSELIEDEVDIQYDLLGNITFKTGVGSYQYDIENPYKLESINGMPAHIDPNKYKITYNSFNKVTNVTKSHGGPVYALSAEMNLVYGVDNQRIKQTINRITEGLITSKIYVGGDFEKHIENDEVKYVHYIHSPQGLIAIMEQGATRDFNYVLKDHLGSIQVLVDGDGTIVQEFSYDPWGMRRCPQTWQLFYSEQDYLTDQGFTGHEHMDIFMLVNMNGRIYDPLVGRFLSPDPVLQFPNYTQGLNPYAYALNNPLRFVDPDGYSLVGNLFAISFQIALTSMGMPWLGVAAYSLIMTLDQQADSRGQIKFASTYIQTFIISGISMGATNIIGRVFDAAKGMKYVELKRALAHGAFNGTMRMAQGGKFEHGFMSGFVSSLGGSFVQSHSSNMPAGIQIAMSAAIGGTAEALGGGKFANGAVTGAYVMMFNHMNMLGQEQEPKEWLNDYVVPEEWDNFHTLDYTDLNDNQRAQHIFDALKFAKDNGLDPIIPLHRIFDNLKNQETMRNDGIKINYAAVTLENQQFEVFVEIGIVSSLKNSKYGYPTRNTTILFGGACCKEVPFKPGWYINSNTQYRFQVKGIDNMLNFNNILGL